MKKPLEKIKSLLAQIPPLLKRVWEDLRPKVETIALQVRQKTKIIWQKLLPLLRKVSSESLTRFKSLSQKVFPQAKSLALKVLSGVRPLLQKCRPLLEKAKPFLLKVRPWVDPWVSRLRRLPRRQLIVWGTIALFGIFVTKGVFFKKKEAARPKAEAPAEEQVLPVKVFKVTRYNYEDSLNALGNIKGSTEFKLSFEIPGVINSINYREGERYEEGALLISLKQDDILLRLKRAQAEMNKAETALAITEEKRREHEKLLEIGAIPKMTVDKVKLEVESARYDLEAARMEVKANESMLEKSNLYAPTDGRIGELYVEEGEAITPNTLAGSHIATDVVLAEFGVVERDLVKISLGQKARVYVDAYPENSFEGIVENISPVVMGSSRTATAKVRIENPDGLLLPGMFSRIKILLFAKRNTLVVPTDSVQGTEEESFVWVVDPKTNEASKKKIRIGYKRPDYAQVDAGLEDEDLVCVTGFEKLAPGAKVKIIEKQEVEQ